MWFGLLAKVVGSVSKVDPADPMILSQLNDLVDFFSSLMGG